MVAMRKHPGGESQMQSTLCVWSGTLPWFIGEPGAGDGRLMHDPGAGIYEFQKDLRSFRPLHQFGNFRNVQGLDKDAVHPVENCVQRQICFGRWRIGKRPPQDELAAGRVAHQIQAHTRNDRWFLSRAGTFATREPAPGKQEQNRQAPRRGWGWNWTTPFQLGEERFHNPEVDDPTKRRQPANRAATKRSATPLWVRRESTRNCPCPAKAPAPRGFAGSVQDDCRNSRAPGALKVGTSRRDVPARKAGGTNHAWRVNSRLARESRLTLRRWYAARTAQAHRPYQRKRRCRSALPAQSKMIDEVRGRRWPQGRAGSPLPAAALERTRSALPWRRARSDAPYHHKPDPRHGVRWL